jgi:hypothetical protein
MTYFHAHIRLWFADKQCIADAAPAGVATRVKRYCRTRKKAAQCAA